MYKTFLSPGAKKSLAVVEDELKKKPSDAEGKQETHLSPGSFTDTEQRSGASDTGTENSFPFKTSPHYNAESNCQGERERFTLKLKSPGPARDWLPQP